MSLFIRAGKYWWVSSKVGRKDGLFRPCYLRTERQTDEDKMMPPVKGWQYGWWEADPTLEASRQVSKPCSEVLVELHGAAKDWQPSCAGIYKPVKGRHNRGRWVSSFLVIDMQSKGIGSVINKR